jgi:hypothetical protein
MLGQLNCCEFRRVDNKKKKIIIIHVGCRVVPVPVFDTQAVRDVALLLLSGKSKVQFIICSRCTELISHIHLHSLYRDLWLQARCLSRFVTDNYDFTCLLKICCKPTEMLWERNSKRIRSCSVSLMSSQRAEWVQLDSRADDFRATAYTPSTWPTQPPIQRERRFFPRVKWPALETCHELPSKAEV